jgi:subtilisin family serine protease
MSKSFIICLLALLLIIVSCNGGGGGGSADGGAAINNDDVVTPPDPLLEHSWHLKNLGQSAFSQSFGISGQDINLDELHSQGIRGKGVTVAVSDGRIDINHEDLKSNTSNWLSRNYVTSPGGIYSNPTSSNPTDFHGTGVMGLIGAVANNLGSRGVAPDATLAGFNFLDSDGNIGNLVHQAKSSLIDIFNYSYGSKSCAFWRIDPLYLAQILTGIKKQRNGKGSIYVTSSGNNYVGDVSECNENFSGLYFGNANLDQFKSSPFVLSVGALNSSGAHTEYSTPGSNIWISAPGGGDGETEPGLITTDLEGCSYGRSISTSVTNNFEKGLESLNSNCNYTSSAVGTSFAAPIVSGVIALMLSVNPDLSWRDVKHILATTATKTNPTAGSENHPLQLDIPNNVYQFGWIENKAGYWFHNRYGFGRVNAKSAVEMAKNYSSLLGDLIDFRYYPSDFWPYSKDVNNGLIPDYSSTGITDKINFKSHLSVESVQILLNIDHLNPSDIGIELKSPMGTTLKLMNINSGIITSNLYDVILTASGFYGEDAFGEWQIKIIDGMTGVTGVLKDWKINILGHKIPNTSDLIAPNPPVNLRGNQLFKSKYNSPEFRWDVDEDVARFEFCVGTSPSDCSKAEWTNIGPTNVFSVKSLNLLDGESYYFNLRSIDSWENKSEPSTSVWTNAESGTWFITPVLNAPSGRNSHSAVFTGNKMIINGGNSGNTWPTSGGILDLQNLTWSSANSSCGKGYYNHSGVWTGTLAAYWGKNTGLDHKLCLFNPSANTSSFSSVAPICSSEYGSSIWTGSKIIVWGGVQEGFCSKVTQGSYETNKGAVFDPNTNSWSLVSTNQAPSKRALHSSIWTGSEMIVWGGRSYYIDPDTSLDGGGRYDPNSNTWSQIQDYNSPGNGLVVWSGKEMIVINSDGGGKYDPSKNKWTKINSAGLPTSPQLATWAGDKVIVYSGNYSYGGGIYYPESDTWEKINPLSSSEWRAGLSAAWVGDALMIWGGTNYTNYFNTGGVYVPYSE